MPISRNRRSFSRALVAGTVTAAAVFCLGAGPAVAAKQNLSCEKIPLGQCLQRVEKAFGVTIAINPAVTAQNVQVATGATDPVAAVKDVIEAVGGLVPAIEQDAAKKHLAITIIDAKGQMFPPTASGTPAGAKAVASEPAKPAATAAANGATEGGVQVPPNEAPPVELHEDLDTVVFPANGDNPPVTLRELRAKAAELNLDDPDRIVEMPDENFPKMTVRQLNAIRDRDALQQEDPDAPVAPGQPKDSVLTMGEVKKIREQDAEALKNQKEVVMPDGTTFSVEALKKAAAGQQ